MVLIASARTLLASAFEIPEVEWMRPNVGHVGGGEVVTLSGRTLASVRNLPGVELTCKFDTEFVRAYYVDDETVKCTAPAHTEGFVNVEFALNNETGDFLRTKGYQFVGGAKVDALTSIYGISGGVVDVMGADMHVSQYCRFGDRTTTGYIVSSGLMRCESPSIDIGTVSVDVSLTESSFFEAYSSVQHVYIGEPSVSRVSPSFGTSSGGTTVTVTGQNFAPTSLLRCRFGAVEVTAVWQMLSTLECTTPATVTEAKSFGVSMNQRDFTTFTKSFTFGPSLTVDAISPSQVSTAGSSHVSITVPGVVSTPELTCRFGSRSVPAVRSGENIVSCVAPAMVGFVTVAVAANGEDFMYSTAIWDRMQLEMKEIIEITRIAPRYGAVGGGTLVYVEGQHLLQDNPVCRFGTINAAAKLVSSALMICETSAMLEGAYTLDVSVVATSPEVNMKPQFLFDHPPVVTALSPFMGLIEGGTTVTAAGHSFSDTHDLACYFGSIGPVVGEWVAEDEYRCVSPAHEKGLVNFDVGMLNEFGAMFADGPPITFLYADDASVTTIIDNQDDTATITGDGFVPGQDVYCNLGNGDALVPGVVLSDGSVLCGLPEDNNGVDEYDITIVDSKGNNIVSTTDANNILTRKVQLNHLSPMFGPAIGGLIVTVNGDHFSPTSLCRFGTLAPFPAVFISTSQVVCEAPSMEVGFHDLAISNNAFDWSIPGLPFEFINTSSSVLTAVSPSSGTTQGGTILAFSAQDLRTDIVISFRIGTILNVAGRWLAKNRATCISPAHITSVVPVEVFHHDTGSAIKLMNSAITYEYKEALSSQQSSQNAFVATPESGFFSGGVAVTLHDSGFYGNDRTCKFGYTGSNAVKVSNTTVCNAPASKSGFTVIEVSMNSHDFITYGVDFQYVTKPRLTSLAPHTAPTIGGSLVYVHGSNMMWGGSNYSVSCVFSVGASRRTSEVHLVSSAVVICTTPTGEGDVDVQLLYNDAERSTSVDLRYEALPEVETDHSIARGVEFGGSAIEIFGDFSTDLGVMFCRVGTISGITLTHGSSERVVCVLPAHSPGFVNVTVTMNNRDSAFNSLSYEYFASILEVTDSQRASVWLDGGSLLEIPLNSSGIRPAFSIEILSIACVFNLDPVLASVGSDGRVQCLAPAHSSGFVAVGVHVQDVSVSGSFSMQVMYETTAQVRAIHPHDGTKGGGEIVKLTGEHFSEPMQDKFIFGTAELSTGKFISSALCFVEQPQSSAESVVLSFLSPGSSSLNDDEFKSTGLVFNFFEEDDAPLHVLPVEGNEEGGGIVTVYYAIERYQQSFDYTACKFGTIGPVLGQLTGTGLECHVPSHKLGEVEMFARLFGEMFTRTVHKFTYRETIEVVSSAVYPSFGAMSGGSSIRILHENSTGVSVKCHVAGLFVDSTLVLPTPSPYVYVSECIMPPYTPGFAQVTLGAAPGKDADDALFLFQPEPYLTVSYPTLISNTGGELVTVSGENFLHNFDPATGSESVLCYFGDQSMVAQVHSTAFISCESPFFSENEGDVDLHVDNGGSAGYDEMMSMPIRYLPVPTFVDFREEFVPSSGGVVVQANVVASTSTLEQTLDTASVRVGSIGPLLGRNAGARIEFVAPAHSPTDSIRVWLASHLSSPHFTHFTLVYAEEDFEIMDAVPDRDSSQGGARVTLGVLAHEDSYPSRGCMFGYTSVPVVQGESNNEISRCTGGNRFACVTYELTCIVPSHSIGFVELRTIGFEGAGVSFEMFVSPSITGSIPSVGVDKGSSVVHVSGKNLHNSDYCHFGVDKSDAIPISSALGVCTSPTYTSLEPGTSTLVSLGVSPRDNPDAISQMDAAFQYVDDYFMVPHPEQYLSPNGGARLTVDLVNLNVARNTPAAAEIFCRFGTIGPILALEQGEDGLHVTCVSPAAVEATTISVWLTHNSQDNMFVSDFVHVTSFPFDMRAVLPMRGISTGDQDVRFVSDPPYVTNPADVRYGCKINATMFMEGSLANVYTGLCRIPFTDVGFSVITWMVATDTSAHAEFEIFKQPKIASMHPMQGPTNGTTLVHVSGDNLHEIGYCYFGTRKSDAHIVSTSVGVCVSPPQLNAEVEGAGMGLRDDSTMISHYGTPFSYVENLALKSLSPESGSENGGTTLSISVSGLQDSVRYSCKIGTIFPITAYVTQSNVVTCITPAYNMTLGPPEVSISPNNRDIVSASPPLMYYFRVPPTISGIVPKVGLSGSRSPIFITGSNFVNSSTMVCRFGRELTAATYLSSRSVLCVAGLEQTGTRTVFVEVSVNGVDFSDSRLLFHFAQCPTGSYCPGNEPVLCPRGAFCDGGKNFTLCSPGSFQPRTGQSNCLPTPIGFISPEAGAFIPDVCPKGYVCDTTGLAIPNKLCPPGHYCLEGTRTSDFTNFVVAERPLPCPFGMYCTAGVVSSASIVHNFSTPQQCYAGYVCEPGSMTPQGTGPCPPGHYCPPGQQLRCPNKGVYCPGVANTEPKPCLPGEYNSEYGQQTCKKCPKGTICPGFARELPEVCTPGFVCDTEGLAVAGTRCPAGHYCLENTVTRDPLAVVDEESILTASPIPLNKENFRPKPCPPTTFCTEGVTTDVVLEGSFKQPQPCKEGSFCEWATGDSTIVSDSAQDVYNPMRPCPAGHYCPKRTYIPIPSPRGSYTFGEGNTAAVTCLPGTYTPYEGFQECLKCPAGYECVDEGTFKPTACQPGYFRSARDPIACRQCPKGTWSSAIALTEGSMCIPCNPGLVCAIDGMSNNKPRGSGTLATNVYSAFCDADSESYDANRCILTQLDPDGQAELCPEGYVCDARTSIAEHKCPDGYYCGYGTTPETQFNNLCPAGYYCPAGSAYTTRQQFPCQACFFCNEGTGQVLERCPNGTQSSPLAKSKEQCSADLITFWRINPISFDLIENIFELVLNTTTTVGTEEQDANKVAQTVFEDQRRKLLESASAPAPDPNVDPNATDPFNYMGMGGCQNKNWHLLQPQFIKADNNINVTVDEENIPLTMFTLPRGHTAKIKFDWRSIDPDLVYGDHFELLIFTDPAVRTTKCAESEFKTVPCPPWDVGDGISWLDMREIPGAEQEQKCPPSQESLELPFWFNRNNDGSTTGYNVDNPSWGTYVWKTGMHELSLHANDDFPFRIEVRMLHGLYQAENRASFLNTFCIDVEYPKRGDIENPTFAFHAILPAEIDEEFQSPLNAPLSSSLLRSVSNDYFNCANINQDLGCRSLDSRVTLDYNSTYGAEWKKFKYLRCGDTPGTCSNATVLGADVSPSQNHVNLTINHIEDWVITAKDGQTDETVEVSLPDVYEQEKYLLNEGLWTSGAALFAVDYLPFFSACRGFDSHIYLAHVTETAWTPLQFDDEREFVKYGEASLVDELETIPINPYSPQVQTPVADEVSITAQCFYEEAFTEPSAKKRWYEGDGDVLFYLTASAESQEALFAASIIANDQTEPPASTAQYEADINNQLNIPVSFEPAEGVVLAAGLIPTVIDFDIFYFQVSKKKKRIVTAVVTMDEYVTAKTHDGTYTLNINFAAMTWFDLVNAFAFDFFFYFILFLAIGALAVVFVFAVLVVVRMFTLLKDPPKFRFLPYLRIIIGPPLMGVSLGMAPFIAAQFIFQSAFSMFPLLVEFPINIDDFGREGDPALLAQIPKATTGRYGVCFLTASMYIMGCCAEIMIPGEIKDEEQKELEDERYVDEVMFKPEVWKRSHFVLLNLLVNVTNVLIIEFSFTDTFGAQFFTIFFLLKIFHIILEMQVETALGEAFLLAPVSLVLGSSVGLATIGADDFTDFTLGFFFEMIMGMVEYVYLDAFIAWCALVLPNKINKMVDFVLELLPFSFGDDDIEEEPEVDIEDTLVEDLMGFLASYGGNAAALWMTPPFIFFFWQYNDSLRLSHQYGFKKNDLLIYFLFSVVIIPFQIIMDVFTFNIQELFHGWKVYEYLKYARYRFVNRTARWKGLEQVYDESIDPGLRAIDQMCFSSQFYFVLALGGSGSFLFVLAISMMLRFSYNMFEDILFLPLVIMVLAGSYILKRISLILADRVGLWTITSSITSGEMIIEDDLEEDFGAIFAPKSIADKMKAVHAAEGGQGDSVAITTAELTSDYFRHLFMSKNRDWVIDQLQEILSPRTAQRLKLGKAVRRRQRAGEISDSDDDMEDNFGEVHLSEPAAKAMRAWVAHAAARAAGRGSHLGMLSDTSESEAEAALQRFPPIPALSEGASAAMTGWLAAVKQLRASRQPSPRSAAFSSTDFSSESETEADARFSSVKNLSETSKGAMKSWLMNAREARAQLPPAPQEITSDDSSESSSLLSSDSTPTAVRTTLSSTATSVMGGWLQSARAARMAAPARAPPTSSQRAQTTSSDSDSSILDSSDPELPFDATRAARPTAASQGAMHGWLSSVRSVLTGNTSTRNETDDIVSDET